MTFELADGRRRVWVVRSWRAALVAVGLVALLAGCGGHGGSAVAVRTAPSTAAPVSLASTEITYLCGNDQLCGVLGDGSDAAVLPLPGVKQSGGTSLSPDGRQAATAPSDIGADGLENDGVVLSSASDGDVHTIWSAPPEGYDIDDYISGPGSPAWNPAGTAVAVSEPTLDASLNDEDCQIWVVPTSGRGAHAVSAAGGQTLHCAPPIREGQSLTWSPNGKTLAYAPLQGLMTVPAAGGTPTLLRPTPGTTIGSVAWAPDGSTILAEVFAGSASDRSTYTHQGGIEAFPLNGGPPTVLIPPGSAQLSLYAPGLAWSPDGKRFAFIRAQPGTEGSDVDYSIVTAAANGTGLQTVAMPAPANPFALTGWTRTVSGTTGLGPGTSPTTTPPPPPPTSPSTTVPPLQAPVNGPVPAVTLSADPKTDPTVAPGVGPPPTKLTGKNLVVGTGPQATVDSTVVFKSVTTFYTTGDSIGGADVWANPEPVPTPVDDFETAGFRDAIVGMRVGGIREVVAPPALAFGGGESGSGIFVPANTTIVFVIDLLSVS